MFRIVRKTLVARFRVLIAEKETAVISIAFAIVGGSRQSPRPLRIDLAQQFQVPFIAHGKIITAITQIKSSVALVALGRHDESATEFLRKWKEAVGDGQR